LVDPGGHVVAQRRWQRRAVFQVEIHARPAFEAFRRHQLHRALSVDAAPIRRRTAGALPGGLLTALDRGHPPALTCERAPLPHPRCAGMAGRRREIVAAPLQIGVLLEPGHDRRTWKIRAIESCKSGHITLSLLTSRQLAWEIDIQTSPHLE